VAPLRDAAIRISQKGTMGLVTLGIPERITVELSRLNRSTVFVETGTYLGGTTRWAATQFDRVHTIEQAEQLYQQHSPGLAAMPNVTTHLGDSRTILPSIVAGLEDCRATFWLDGHYSGGETAGEHDECPLLDELISLGDRRTDIILIDDARLFLTAPPSPHQPSAWPTFADIIRQLPAAAAGRFVQVIDDVIFIVPDKEPLRGHLTRHAQARADAAWQDWLRQQDDSRTRRGMAGFFSRLRR